MKTKQTMIVKLTDRELATVLFTLRFWQTALTPNNREQLKSLENSEHFQEHRPLSAKEIDRLCEKLNFSEWASGTK